MALEYSTIGTRLYYATESTAGTKPSSFTELENITAIGEDNGEPEQIEVTNLVDTRHRSIAGLAGDTSLFNVTANFTQAFQTAWETLVTAAETAKAAGKATWFEIRLPGHTKSWQFAGTPQPLGFGGANVAENQSIQVYITKEQVDGWTTANS